MSFLVSCYSLHERGCLPSHHSPMQVCASLFLSRTSVELGTQFLYIYSSHGARPLTRSTLPSLHKLSRAQTSTSQCLPPNLLILPRPPSFPRLPCRRWLSCHRPSSSGTIPIATVHSQSAGSARRQGRGRPRTVAGGTGGLFPQGLVSGRRGRSRRAGSDMTIRRPKTLSSSIKTRMLEATPRPPDYVGRPPSCYGIYPTF